MLHNILTLALTKRPNKLESFVHGKLSRFSNQVLLSVGKANGLH